MTRLLLRLLGTPFLLLSIGLFAQDEDSTEQSTRKLPALETDQIESHLAPLATNFADDLRRARSEVVDLEDSDAERADKADAWGNLGMIYHGQQLNELAQDAYLRAMSYFPDSRWHYLTAVLQLSRGKVDLAVSHLQQVVFTTPDYSPAWYRLGLIYLSKNDPEEAAKALEQARTLSPEEPAVLVGLADVAAANDQRQQATDLLTQAWAEAPGNSQIAFKLATSYRELGDTEQYEEWIANADGEHQPPSIDDPLLVQVASLSRNSNFYLTAAEWAVQRGDYPAAMSALKSASEIDPTNLEISQRYVAALAMSENFESALAESKRILEHHLESADAWFMLAWLSRRIADPELFLEGLLAAERSLELADTQRTRRLAAAMHIVAQQFAQAQSHYEQLLAGEPDSSYYLYWLGMVKLGQGDCTGRAELTKAVNSKPDWGEALVSLSRAHAMCGDADRSRQALARFGTVTENPEVQLARAYLQLAEGTNAPAKEVAEEWLPLPDAQLILNFIDAQAKPNTLYAVGSTAWLPQELL